MTMTMTIKCLRQDGSTYQQFDNLADFEAYRIANPGIVGIQDMRVDNKAFEMWSEFYQAVSSAELKDYYERHGRVDTYLYNNRLFSFGFITPEQYNENHSWITNYYQNEGA